MFALFAKVLQNLLEESDKWRKRSLTTEEILNAKDNWRIRELIPHVKYPDQVARGDEERRFLPFLILHRCSFMIRNPPEHFHYEDVLADLRLVGENWMDSLPRSEHHNFYYLKTLCLMKMKQFGEAERTHEAANSTLAMTNFNERVLEERRRKIEKGFADIKKFGAENKVFNGVRWHPKKYPELSDKNADYPTLCEAVTVKTDGNKVYLEATRDIQPGEVLAAEEPLLVLKCYGNLAFGYSHYLTCHHCLKETFHCFPCIDCNWATFCSLNCRDEAMRGYHKFECKLGLGIGAKDQKFCQERVLTALRFIFSQDPDLFTRERDETGSTAAAPNPNDKDYFVKMADFAGKYPVEEKYREKFADLIKVESELALRLIKRSGYLDSLDNRKEEIFLKNVRKILTTKSMRVIGVFRVHSNSRRMKNPSGLYRQPNLTLTGFALYGRMSLATHSCIPNACFVPHEGGKAGLYAVDAVKKGHEISVNQFNVEPNGSNMHSAGATEFSFPAANKSCPCWSCENEVCGCHFKFRCCEVECLLYKGLHGATELKFVLEDDFDGVIRKQCEEMAEMNETPEKDEYSGPRLIWPPRARQK